MSHEPLLTLAASPGLQPVIRRELIQRIAVLSDELKRVFETWRNDARIPAAEFIKQAGRLIRLRGLAESRLQAVDPAAVIPVHPDPGTELFNLIGSASLKRDGAINELRAARTAAIFSRRAELMTVETQIAGAAGIFRNAVGHPNPNPTPLGIEGERAGEDPSELGATIFRLTPLLAQRDKLAAELQVLDPPGSGFTRAIAQVVERLGKAKVVKAITRIGVNVTAAALQSRCTKIMGRYATLDPESETAAALKAEAEAAKAELMTLNDAHAARQTAQAAELVESACAGKESSYRELVTLAGGNQDLHEALTAIQGGTSELAAAITVFTQGV